MYNMENIENIEKEIYLVDGNPGAIEVMNKLKRYYPDKLPVLLVVLQTKNIRGVDIWIIYKSCAKNIDEFVRYPFDIYKKGVKHL
jgi:hypothetical protein